MTRGVLDIEVPCHVSGLLVGDTRIGIHMVPLVLLPNGSLMAYCPNHRNRSFIADATTIHLILKNATIVRKIEKPIKEPKNGKTQERGSAEPV
jgi:hypothetical protein